MESRARPVMLVGGDAGAAEEELLSLLQNINGNLAFVTTAVSGSQILLALLQSLQ